MNKLLLLDKDGTIVTSVHESGFIDEPWHQKPIEGVKNILERAKAHDWEIKICSNQGGVAAGHKSLEKVFQEMRFLLELFPEVAEAYFCPDFEGEICWYCWDDCSEEHRIKRIRENAAIWYASSFFEGDFPRFRKPGAGMLLAAADDCVGKTLFVGDRPEDEEAARSANIPFLWAADWLNSSSWLD